MKKYFLIIIVLSIFIVGCKENPIIETLLSPADCSLSASANEVGGMSEYCYND